MPALKEHFLLDPDVIFLNHGSFGATPIPVFEAYQAWQRQLERQPVQFIVSELNGHLAQARQCLASYLQANPADVGFVPNATFGVNLVARSLPLQPDDEILASAHEYGACENVWAFLCQKTGAVYRRQPIPLPLASPEEVVAHFWQGVTPRTKVIFISHLTSPTALRLPVAAICQRARAAGILTLVDGAHAPGQLPLDLPAIGADFYTGNGHKWMLAPKGSAFLYARPEKQALLEPLVVGWGWSGVPEFETGSRFLDHLQWLGTQDYSAYLAVPAALQFQEEHDWPAVRVQCHHLLQHALERLAVLTGCPSLYADPQDYVQMGVAPLPRLKDIGGLKQRLYADYRVEVPLITWQDQHFVRISVQGYNTLADVDALLTALERLLPQFVEDEPRSY
jgi:isopenicillin-N epimerase